MYIHTFTHPSLSSWPLQYLNRKTPVFKPWITPILCLFFVTENCCSSIRSEKNMYTNVFGTLLKLCLDKSILANTNQIGKPRKLNIFFHLSQVSIKGSLHTHKTNHIWQPVVMSTKKFRRFTNGPEIEKKNSIEIT